ncbi:MAG: stage 0 sporulation protein [Spirochaetes bacterium]|nr:stage 0 sporulation protein [Spirochaetota bacterium]
MKVVSVKIDQFVGCYYCDPSNVEIRLGNVYIIQTQFGLDSGKVCKMPFEIKSAKNTGKIVRIANQDDFKKMEKLDKKNAKALKTAQDKLVRHKLPMKIFSAKYMFDENRLIFYFTSENRIDFRSYVRDLAAVFKKRIELRQVPYREETQMLGGLGICGKEFCCVHFLPSFNNVSIKMAKEQNLSLNTVKISGVCDKLLCCLAYEYDTYTKLRRDFPKEGTKVKFNVNDVHREKYIGYNLPSSGDVAGKVKNVNVLRRTVYVEIEGEHVLEIKLDKIKKSGVFNVIK